VAIVKEDLPGFRKFVVKLLLFLALVLAISEAGAAILRRGVFRYFGIDRPVDLLIIGHSHAIRGIDERILSTGTGMRVAKFALPGTNIFEHQAMVKLYFRLHPQAQTTVLYDVHGFSFSHLKISKNSAVLFYPFMDDPDMDRYLFGAAPNWLEYAARKYVKLLRYNNHEVLAFALRGYLGHGDDAMYGKMKEPTLPSNIPEEKRIRVDRAEVACFEDTLAFLRGHGELVLVAIPTTFLVNGADRDRHNRVIAMFHEYAANGNRVHFIDYNPAYEHKYEFFFDEVHLNRLGRDALSRNLVQDLIEMRRRGGK
jgi:hypothetical protein